ncbi:hypothetical protein D9M72_257400 [compost metagenome]
MRQARHDAVEQHLHLARDQVRHGQRGAAVGDVGDEHARLRLEGLGGQVHHGAVAAGSVVQFAGMLLGVVDQLAHVLRRQAVRHHQQVGGDRHLADRGEVGLGVVRQAGVDIRPDRMRAGGGDQQRIAIGRSLGGHVRADRAAGAGAVVDHDLLAHAGAHLLRDGACQQVSRAAGREGHDQADRLAGVGVGQCGRGGQAKPAAKADAEAAQPGFHTCLRCQAIGPDS